MGMAEGWHALVTVVIDPDDACLHLALHRYFCEDVRTPRDMRMIGVSIIHSPISPLNHWTICEPDS